MAVELTKDSIDLGIVTRDAEAALKFYRDTLGFKAIGEMPMPKEDIHMMNQLSYRSIRLFAIAALVAVLSVQGCGVASTADDEALVRAVFEDGAKAWSQGNIDGYLDGYWKSEKLRWVSDGTIIEGWAEVEEAFKKRFDKAENIGVLTASDLDIEILSATDALVFGVWTQETEAATRTGFFTVHLKKIDGRWKIISDHSSTGSPM